MKKQKIDWKNILWIVCCLLTTALSFVFYFVFKPLDYWWIIIICGIDVGLTLILAFNNTLISQSIKVSKRLVSNLVYIGLYFIVFYVLALILSIEFETISAIKYWLPCIYFSFFILPSYYLALPIMLFLGEGVGG